MTIVNYDTPSFLFSKGNYCCPVNNYSPLYCFVIQCFISIFTKGACLYTMRAESPIITLLVLPDGNNLEQDLRLDPMSDETFYHQNTR